MDYEMRGVTFIELIIVLTIIGIITLLAAVSVRWQANESRLSAMRDKFLADCEFIRINSIAREPHGIFMYPDKYEIRRLHDTNKNFIRDTGESTYLFPAPDGTVLLSEGMSLLWNSCKKNNELWFDRKGIPRCQNWGLGMGTFTFKRDDQKKTISIDRAGRIKYE
jgi:prepilin-type N-terminal cleavage/methylation domain-containing protein